MTSLITKSSIGLSRLDILAVILFQFKLAKTIKECHESFCTAFPNNKVSSATIKRWNREFNCGNFNLEDQPRLGSLSNAVTKGIVESIEDTMIADPNIAYERIQHEIGISSGAVQTILHQSLQYASFVPV